MEQAGSAGKPSRMIGAAAARLASRKWACPECAGDYGCRAGGRSCEVCSPPRNPQPSPGHWWEDE